MVPMRGAFLRTLLYAGCNARRKTSLPCLYSRRHDLSHIAKYVAAESRQNEQNVAPGGKFLLFFC